MISSWNNPKIFNYLQEDFFGASTKADSQPYLTTPFGLHFLVHLTWDFYLNTCVEMKSLDVCIFWNMVLNKCLYSNSCEYCQILSQNKYEETLVPKHTNFCLFTVIKKAGFIVSCDTRAEGVDFQTVDNK